MPHMLHRKYRQSVVHYSRCCSKSATVQRQEARVLYMSIDGQQSKAHSSACCHYWSIRHHSGTPTRSVCRCDSRPCTLGDHCPQPSIWRIKIQRRRYKDNTTTCSCRQNPRNTRQRPRNPNRKRTPLASKSIGCSHRDLQISLDKRWCRWSVS